MDSSADMMQSSCTVFLKVNHRNHVIQNLRKNHCANLRIIPKFSAEKYGGLVDATDPRWLLAASRATPEWQFCIGNKETKVLCNHWLYGEAISKHKKWEKSKMSIEKVNFLYTYYA